MDVKELRRLKPELESFLDRYAPRSGRPEAQGHGRRFIQGLLPGGDRRGVENIAEAIDGCVARSPQTFITNAPWEGDEVLGELRRPVTEEWGDADAVVTVDETGFPKPFKWMAGDSVDGDSPAFCQGVRALGKWYVPDSSADTRVWATEPEVIPPGRKPARGRATTKPKVATKPVRVDRVANRPASAWRRGTVAEGSQGLLIDEYADVRVWFSEEGLPSGPERLLACRPPGQEPERK